MPIFCERLLISKSDDLRECQKGFKMSDYFKVFLPFFLLITLIQGKTVIVDSVSSTGLKHPGCLQSSTEINALAKAIHEAAPDSRRMGFWQLMINNSRGKITGTDWIVPEHIYGTDFGNAAKLGGAGLIRYVNDWVITGNIAADSAAIKILNSWGAVKSFTADSTDNNAQHRLTGGMYLGYIAHAADMLMSSNTAWDVAEQNQFKEKLRTVILPIIYENRAVNFNGNWDLGASWSIMAIAVCLDDKELFNEQIEWLKSGETNARITHYLLETGQTQETHRDQLHVAMGLTHLQLAAQIAWNQGIDLYEYGGRSVGKALEYFAAYNLGEENLPFQAYPCGVGSNSAHDYNMQISDIRRPNFDKLFEMVYHHYKNYRGIELPYTKTVLENHTRPEEPGPRWSNHNTALYWNLNLSEDALKRQIKEVDVTLDIKPEYHSTPFIRQNCGGSHVITSKGTVFTRERGTWNVNGKDYLDTTIQIVNSDDHELYQTWRSGSKSFGYFFGSSDPESARRLPDGKYLVRFHFVETEKDSENTRLFDVLIEGKRVIENLDIFATAGKNTLYTHETSVTVSDGALDIEFIGVLGNGIVSAIEVEPFIEQPTSIKQRINRNQQQKPMSSLSSSSKGYNLHYTLPQNSSTTISLYDFRGRMIKKISFPHQRKGAHKVPIKTQNMGPGMYLMRVQCLNSVEVMRFIIQ